MKIDKTKFKTLLGGVLWYILIFGIIFMDFFPTAEDADSSYLCLYADFSLWLFHIVLLFVLLAAYVILSIRLGKDNAKAIRSTTPAIIGMLVISVITLAVTIIISGYYDAVRIDPANGDSFISHKPLREPTAYTVRDVSEAEFCNTYDARLHMNDGTEISLICGYEEESEEFFEKYGDSGKYVSELFTELSDMGIPVIVNNREKIESVIAKGSDSDNPYFTECLPKILECADK